MYYNSATSSAASPKLLAMTSTGTPFALNIQTLPYYFCFSVRLSNFFVFLRNLPKYSRRPPSM